MLTYLSCFLLYFRPWNVAATQTTLTVASKAAGYGASEVVTNTAINSILMPDYSMFQNIKGLNGKGEMFIEMNGI